MIKQKPSSFYITMPQKYRDAVGLIANLNRENKGSRINKEIMSAINLYSDAFKVDTGNDVWEMLKQSKDEI